MGVHLISAGELKQLILDCTDLSLVDTRGEDAFAEGHIPGAFHIAWEEWCAKPPAGLSDELNQPGYWGLLTSMDDHSISGRLSALGFRNNKLIVVYADGEKSKGREGRIAWMLLYYGAENVCLLNGGYKAWCADGGMIETTANASGNRTDFKVVRDENRRMRLESLRTLMKNEPLLLIDTRSVPEFVGDSYPYMPRPGTLPEAHLIPYASIFQEDGTFISKAAFLSRLPEALNTGLRAVAFCEVGVRACTVALLNEIYTGKKMPVYDGSMMEWGADPELPVARPSPPN